MELDELGIVFILQIFQLHTYRKHKEAPYAKRCPLMKHVRVENVCLT